MWVSVDMVWLLMLIITLQIDIQPQILFQVVLFASKETKRRPTNVSPADNTDTGVEIASSSDNRHRVHQATTSAREENDHNKSNGTDSTLKDKYENDNVKRSLKRNIECWENIHTSQYILDIIKNGYVIPFINTPPKMIIKNNRHRHR